MTHLEKTLLKAAEDFRATLEFRILQVKNWFPQFQDSHELRSLSAWSYDQGFLDGHDQGFLDGIEAATPKLEDADG